MSWKSRKAAIWVTVFYILFSHRISVHRSPAPSSINGFRCRFYFHFRTRVARIFHLHCTNGCNRLRERHLHRIEDSLYLWKDFYCLSRTVRAAVVVTVAMVRIEKSLFLFITFASAFFKRPLLLSTIQFENLSLLCLGVAPSMWRARMGSQMRPFSPETKFSIYYWRLLI